MPGSWFFDGIDDYIEMPDSAALRSLTSQGTWWGWFKRSGVGQANGPLMHKNRTTSSPWLSYGLGSTVSTGASWRAERGNVAGSWHSTSAVNAAPSTSEWVFMAATYHPGVSSLRFRSWNSAGTLTHDVTNPNLTGDIGYTPGTAPHGLRIMRNQATAYLGGRIAYLGAHNTVLTDAQIDQIRLTGVPPVTPSAFFLPLDSASTVDAAQGGTVQVFGATFDPNDGPPVTPPPEDNVVRTGLIEATSTLAAENEGVWGPSSWYFNGTNNFIQIADNANLRSIGLTGTWWAWYKRNEPDTGSANAAILHKNRTLSAPWVSYGIGRNNPDAFVAWRSTTAISQTSTLQIGLGWKFIAVTYNGSSGIGLTMRVWNADGTLAGSTTNATLQGAIQYEIGWPLTIGRNEADSFLGGKIAFVGAHNEVLTDAQLDQIRTTGVPPVTPSAFFLPLDSMTAVDTAQGGTVTVTGAVHDAQDGPPTTPPNIVVKRTGSIIGTSTLDGVPNEVVITIPGTITDLVATPGNAEVELMWTAPYNGGAPITDYIIQYRVKP